MNNLALRVLPIRASIQTARATPNSRILAPSQAMELSPTRALPYYNFTMQ